MENEGSMLIDRGFVRIEEGLVHYRFCGGPDTSLPLYMIHASPASSVILEPLMKELGDTRRIYAPDTLGNGDSAVPALDEPEIEYYAESVMRLMDALALDRVDLFGSHTGAHIAVEAATRYPERIRKLVLDGITLFPDDLKADLLAHYAPVIEPDVIGSQFHWAWHFVRDQMTHFPYFKRDPDHRRNVPMASPDELHHITVEVLKAIRTYHMAYRAVFRHSSRGLLPLVRHDTLCLGSETDPLSQYAEEAAALIPNAQRTVVSGKDSSSEYRAKASAIREFLDK